MVVGDRLWLFSHQGSNGPPIQSLLMPPNGPAMRPILGPQAAAAAQHFANGRPITAYNNRYLMSSVPGIVPRFPYARTTPPFNSHLPPPPFDRFTAGKDDYLNHPSKFVPVGSSPDISVANGLADLERAFGSSRNFNGDQDSALGDNSRQQQVQQSVDSESEIDCEQVD